MDSQDLAWDFFPLFLRGGFPYESLDPFLNNSVLIFLV